MSAVQTGPPLSAQAEPRDTSPREGRWSRRRWVVLIGLVFAAQAGLMFAFRDRQPVVPRQPARVPMLRLATESSELLALTDPTLFALPHREGFSGAAWLTNPPPDSPTNAWTEPVRWLPPPVEQLGAEFRSFIQTNAFESLQIVAMSEPAPIIPELFPVEPPSTRSTLRIGGDLARRRLITPLVLPSWTNTDLLTNSVVQLLVDARGNVISAALLPPGSGLTAADTNALALANSARFESIEPAGPDRAQHPAPLATFGTMIFEWQTMLTNAPPAAP